MILRGKKRINYMKKAVCMVTACLVLGQTMPVYAQGTSWIDQVEITAHRGDSLKALENTLPAFEKAIESGSDWIELDVNETKDNVKGCKDPGSDAGGNKSGSSGGQYGTGLWRHKDTISGRGLKYL